MLSGSWLACTRGLLDALRTRQLSLVSARPGAERAPLHPPHSNTKKQLEAFFAPVGYREPQAPKVAKGTEL